MPLYKFVSCSTGESEATEVFIYDAAGKTIFNGKTESEMQRFTVPAAGIFLVRVDNRKNYRIVVKGRITGTGPEVSSKWVRETFLCQYLA